MYVCMYVYMYTPNDVVIEIDKHALPAQGLEPSSNDIVKEGGHAHFTTATVKI